MDEKIQTIILAGGCFWCVEHDLRGVPGIVDVVSGYTGENVSITPSYENHEGFREAVLVKYNPNETSFKKIVQFFLDHIDPTDRGGQFGDRGDSYKTAIYYKNEDEKNIAINLLNELDDSKVYDKPNQVEVAPEISFYKAEEYHQRYSEKNKEHYQAYRIGSGREEFVNKICQIREEKKINWKD
jgi:methionine-S-sulfoxide reductase